MPGTFYGIGMASRALRAFQNGLDVTGHNIANANTAGYTRQVAEYTSVDGSTVFGQNAFRLGNGVDMASVNRIRDQFLDARRSGAQAEQSRSGTMLGTLSSIQSVLNEPSANGISAALGKFFDSWSGLSGNPSDPGLRIQVQQSGQSLAAKLRDSYREVQGQLTANTDAIELTFDRIDELSSGLAQVNASIRSAQSTGATANDLLDQQQAILTEIGGLAGMRTTRAADGTVSLNLGGVNLVDSAGSHPIPRIYDAANSTISDSFGSTFTVSSGELNAHFQANSRISASLASLDTLAKSLTSEINAVHQTGVNMLGANGVDFFTATTGAADITLSAAVQADPKAIATGVSGKPGDGGLALAISGMRDASVVTLGNVSFTTFYNEFTTGVSRDVGYFKGLLDTQTAVVEQIDRQIESVSGVSLDDEMANLLKFQRSYQAAAKTLSIFDQMTEDLINLVR